ncbi:histidine kinase [Leptolyngbya sp. 'hensonii']|uniref:sensor histidine kinase n=1 Tax=Leptolyngbya sp. 'hensonii' TaxID=1922337 RepID=UPI00094FB752|nr:ATP-binding protein [Leptolyngbya sp. 'hensonii']OLP17098.1 histidine kinase [Leptolyngbya sp. 'hensonii']
MALSDDFGATLIPPNRSEGSGQDFNLDSTLQELRLYAFEAETHCTSVEVLRVFEKYPLLPGVILTDQGQYQGMLSRQQLMEYLVRPHGMDLFLEAPITLLHSYARRDVLVLAGHTSILVAAQYALRRSSEYQGEPVVVKLDPMTYRLLDVHELNIAYWQIRGIETQVRYERMQVQMIQSDKMANLGRLVDGVAHEVLDPVSFIWGNLTYVSDYAQNLLYLLEAYEAHVPNPPIEIAALAEEIELDYIRKDLLRSFDSIKAGAERLTKLATSLQNFCHIDEVYPKPADLHESIDGILLLLKGRLASDIEVIKHYGDLPPVVCYIGQLSQVFMNIISNAVGTLLDQVVRQRIIADFNPTVAVPPEASELKPRIEITTQVLSIEPQTAGSSESRWVSVRIANNGPLISEDRQKQLREALSEERRAAKETSLSVSYQIITAKHGGKLKLRSPCYTIGTIATGTEFEILLPMI